MAAPPGKGAAQGPPPAPASLIDTVDWSGLRPKRVGREDAMSPEGVAACWAKMYKAARVPGDEEAQAAFRLSCYVYGCVNGTSRVGNYAADIETAKGLKFNASVIPAATESMNIRRFFRGCMTEAYIALKESKAVEDEHAYCARLAGKYNISRTVAFACADYLSNCSYMTPQERTAHDTVFVNAIDSARRNRGGQALDDVEYTERERELAAQGPSQNTVPQTGTW